MTIEAAVETAMVPLGRVRARLTHVWLVWAALIFSLVLIQSVEHKYRRGSGAVQGAIALQAPANGADPNGNANEDLTADVWKWLLPNLLPTLTMMVSAAAASAFIQKETTTVRRDFYISAMGLSVFYLAIVSGLLLCQPIANPNSAVDQLKSLQTSNIATGPVQGLVAAALGVLFSTGKPLDKPAAEDSSPESPSTAEPAAGIAEPSHEPAPGDVHGKA